MVQQMVQIVEGNALFPARCQGTLLLVAVEKSRGRRAEQLRHGQVCFGPAPIDGGVCQHRAAFAAAMDVACPQVAVEQRGGLLRYPLHQMLADALHCRCFAHAEQAVLDGQHCLVAEPGTGEEQMPVFMRWIQLGSSAAVVISAEAEMRTDAVVQCRQRIGAVEPEVSALRPEAYIFKQQKIFPPGDDLGHTHRLAAGKGGESLRFGGEEICRRIPTHLQKQRPVRSIRQLKCLAGVASRYSTQAGRGGFQVLRDGLRQLHRK